MKTVLDVIKTHKNICWYPSSGADFRGLLYLSDRYFEWKNIPREEGQELPDLFIMTDIRVPQSSSGDFASYSSASTNEGEEGTTCLYDIIRNNEKSGTLYSGTRERKGFGSIIRDVTKIRAERVEPLQPLNLGYYKDGLQEIVIEGVDTHIGKAFYIKAHIKSLQPELIGKEVKGNHYEYDADVLYIVADNLIFARDILLEHSIPVPYVIQIRYGDSMGGGSNIGGRWLGYLFDHLQCRYFMGNPQYLCNEPPPEKTKEILDMMFPKWPPGIQEYEWIANFRHGNKYDQYDNYYGKIDYFHIIK